MENKKIKSKVILYVIDVILLAGAIVFAFLDFAAAKYISIAFIVLLAGLVILANILLKRDMQSIVNKAINENKAKSDFLFSMSHAIRTPMHAVVGMTNIAQKNLDNKEVVEDCLEKINMSGRHLVTLINDVLDFTKVENGKYSLSTGVFSISNQISYLQSVIGPELEDKNLTLEIEKEHINFDHVYSDELRLNQIMINILNNSATYTNNGGKVKIKVSEEEVEENPEKVKVIYEISDSGIGMSDEFLKTIFEPYTRAVDARVDKAIGSGLGLTITKQLVDMLGGTITVESKEGVGSKFTVTVECDVALKKKEIKTQNDDLKFNDFHILVVEDNELNYEILNKTLEPYGITMDHAENGEKAIEIMKFAKHGQYKMILMDIEMPNMNGYQATEEIRKIKDAEIASTPIYAITADAFSNDVEKAKKAGMNGHISKPVDFNKVLNVIKNIK